MKKFVLITFIILITITFCSSSSIGSATGDDEDLNRSARRVGACTETWIKFSLRNAACNTWCRQVLRRSGGYCNGSTLICTCFAR
ncbi:CLUMA_CG002030, isoform A [Clunio marinus]|uniref:CLUMA_CG002030, isoform A n=1 Tax=Clunio marinus TaxID=568069 RepID=A0A1J1HPV9_9DIPT|nr:CLUMA_CG002030, isoform A [Clunio marinus]